MSGTPRARINGCVQIDAPPEIVFDVVADERNEPRYHRRVRAVRLVTPAPVGEGSIFQAVTGSQSRPRPMTIEITRFLRPTLLGSATRLPWMDISGEVRFARTNEGTRLHWEWDLHPSRRLARFAPLVALVGGLQERRTWMALKRHVEQAQQTVWPRSSMEDRPPLPRQAAALAVVRCAVITAVLLARREVHLPRRNVGLRIDFGDGTTGRVYRETVVERAPTSDRCVLVVSFRLRAVRGRAHRAFEGESLLNTPLFVGFPGFVSKLWLAADGNGVYRGFYEWDQPRLAEAYARALWRVLALVSVPGSIHYRVLPGLRRDEVLKNPATLDAVSPDQAGAWWRAIGTG